MPATTSPVVTLDKVFGDSSTTRHRAISSSMSYTAVSPRYKSDGLAKQDMLLRYSLLVLLELLLE